MGVTKQQGAEAVIINKATSTADSGRS